MSMRAASHALVLSTSLIAAACGGGGKGLTGAITLGDPTFASNGDDDGDGDDSAPMLTSETGATDTPPTTSGVDPGTTTGASTTAVDPTTSTTAEPPDTTAVDPSTTSGDDTTGVMTTQTSVDTSSETTADPPPDQDAQPKSGLFEDCAVVNNCDANVAGCIGLFNDDMMQVDGYCTDYCETVADCGPGLDVPATLACIDNTGPMMLCALLCETTADCPIGMDCSYYSFADLMVCF